MKSMHVILGFVLIIALLLPTSSIYAADSHIPGFIENMDGLFLRNQPEEFRKFMKNTRLEKVEKRFYSSFLKGTRIMGDYPDLTDEELYDLYMAQEFGNFDYGCKFYTLHTRNYLNQYVEAGKFKYLIDDSVYWWQVPASYWWDVQFVPGHEGPLWAGLAYTMDGIVLEKAFRLTMDEEAYQFVFDYDRVEALLLEAGETQVKSIKLIAHPLAMLYVEGERDEYLVKLGTYNIWGSSAPEKLWLIDVERFVLYSPEEMMGFYARPMTAEEQQIDHGNGPRGRIPAEEFMHVKPTYEAEGQALMEAGIIQGNENGLDPLKPLTRMEATAILVRALGYEDTPVQEASAFVDVPDGYWGKPYANIAAERGISNGVGDGRFAPDAPVTDTQFAAMLLRSSEEAEFNWEQAMDMLIERGIITAEQAAAMDLFTRGDMAKIIYEAREAGLVGC